VDLDVGTHRRQVHPPGSAAPTAGAAVSRDLIPG